ncbi:MAG: DUF4350 domain-containing protein [Myxococcota bacterium]
MRRGALVIGGLMVVALVLGWLARRPGDDSPLPSISNRGPRGAAVLAMWLREHGVEVVAHDAPLTQLPRGLATVVIAAPTHEELRAEEVDALRSFVEGGGTLVYLAPRDGAQPALHRWLGVHLAAPAPLVNEAGLEDVGGTTAKVKLAAGLLDGATALRLSAERMIEVDAPRAVEVVEHGALWWTPVGGGEVWLGAGADLVENARLELADNARFWSRLASRGPIAFDEYHHHRGATQVPVNLVTSALQLVFLAALFAWARGARLGPPRDDPPNIHRSALEYVRAMAALTANAKVDAELVTALRSDFRRRLEDELGISAALGWADAALEFSRRTGEAQDEFLAASREERLLPLSRLLARLERAAAGRG